MNLECFDIYNENMEHIGTELRTVVHKTGLWHKSFQCWFIFEENGKYYMLFQKRHTDKDTYPNLLDITSAGHLSAGEKVEDGVRELKEELGIKIKFEELIPLGVIIEKKSEESFEDNEFANIFLYICNTPMEEFRLQAEEVTGMFKADIDDVINLFSDKVRNIKIEGYDVNEKGIKIFSKIIASKNDFVPHGEEYYLKILSEAKKCFN